MIALPRQLEPWKAQLDLFPDDVALVLGPMVARLAPLIGGAPVEETPEGTPEGLEGIAARGTYDRLLASEWLLLEELPEEFLRRAVSQEHLFLQRSYKANSAARQTIALFDAGAEQLGAPRLAQLALLIAMAKRADDGAATFKWGIFQDTSQTLHCGVDRALVRELLRARCASLVNRTEIDLWMAIPEVLMSSEIWFVGAEALLGKAQESKASAILIADLLAGSTVHQIQIRAVPLAGRAREVLLEVPPGPAGARILRDPFGVDTGGRHVTPRHVDVASSILFSIDGRKLFVRGERGSLITIAIPNSPRAKVLGPGVYVPPEGQSVVAVGQSTTKRRTVVATYGNGKLQIQTLSKRSTVSRSTEIYENFELPAHEPSHPLRPLRAFDSRYYFIDAAGHLIDITKGNPPIRHEIDAVVSRATSHCFVYLARCEDKLIDVFVRPDGTREKGAIELAPMPQDTQFYFAPFVSPSCVAAYTAQDSQCTLVNLGRVSNHSIPPSHRIVGIVVFSGDQPMLVAITGNGMKMEGLRNGSWELLFAVSAPITSAAVSDAGLVAAYITEAGEVGVYSFVYKTMLLQMTMGRADGQGPA